MPRGCLIVGLWCSADFASFRSYRGENKLSFREWVPDPPQWIFLTRVCTTLVQIMGALLTQISGSLTVFWFTSPSSYKVHELIFFQARLNQKQWSGNTSSVFELLVDIGSMGPGNREPEINSPDDILIAWALNPLQLLFCALDPLIQGSHHMYPLKQAELWTW